MLPRDGRSSGSSRPPTIIRRDRTGRLVGTIEPAPLGRGLLVRDRTGRLEAIVREGLGGRLTVRDRTGRPVYRLSPEWNGRRAIYDRFGRRVGTVRSDD